MSTAHLLLLLILAVAMATVNASWLGDLWHGVSQALSAAQSDQSDHADRTDEHLWPTVLWGIADTYAVEGKLFRYAFPPGAFQGKVWKYEVTEAGKKTLPKWLYFNKTSIAVYGVASSHDVGATYIQVTAFGNPALHHKRQDKASTVFLISVQQLSKDPWERLRFKTNNVAVSLKSLQSGSSSFSEEHNACALGENIVTATLLLDTSITELNAKKRVALLFKMSHFLSKPVKRLTIRPKEKSSKLMSESVLMAGPGNADNSVTKTEKEGIALTWHVACGDFPDVKDFAQVLEHNVLGGRIAQECGHQVIGWYVSSASPPEELKRATRVRRQAVRGTVAPTPTVASSLPTKLSSSTSFTITTSIEATSVVSTSLGSSSASSIVEETKNLSTQLVTSASDFVETVGVTSLLNTESTSELLPQSTYLVSTDVPLESTLQTTVQDIQSTSSYTPDLFSSVLETKTVEPKDNESVLLSTSETLSRADGSESIVSTALTSDDEQLTSATTSEIFSTPVTEMIPEVSTEISPSETLSPVLTSVIETREISPSESSSLIMSTDLSFQSSQIETEIESTVVVSPSISQVPTSEADTFLPTKSIDFSITPSPTVSTVDQVTLTSSSGMETFSFYPSEIDETTLATESESVEPSSPSYSLPVTSSTLETFSFYPSEIDETIDISDTKSEFMEPSSTLSLLISSMMPSVSPPTDLSSFTDSFHTSLVLDSSISTVVTSTIDKTLSVITKTVITSSVPQSLSTEIPQTATSDLIDMSDSFLETFSATPSIIFSETRSITSIITTPVTSTQSVRTLPTSEISETVSTSIETDIFSPLLPSSIFPTSVSSSKLSTGTPLLTSKVETTGIPMSTSILQTSVIIIPTATKTVTLSTPDQSVFTEASTFLPGTLPPTEMITTTKTASSSISSVVLTAVSSVQTDTAVVSTMTTSLVLPTTTSVTVSRVSTSTPIVTSVSSIFTSSPQVPSSPQLLTDTLSTSFFSSSVDTLTVTSTSISIVPSLSTTTSLVSSTLVTPDLSTFVTGVISTSPVTLPPTTSSSSVIVTSSVDVTTSSTSVVTTSAPVNRPPALANPVDHISVDQGVYFQYEVPEDTFYDPEDGNTRKLKLYLLTLDKQPLPAKFWVQFNSSMQVIYGLALQNDVTSVPQDFILEAEDSGGSRVQDAFQISINTSSVADLSHSFQIGIQTDFSSMLASLHDRLDLLNSVSLYYGDRYPSFMTVSSFQNGSVVLDWSNNTVSKDVCQNETIEYLFSMIASSNGTVNQSFSLAMAPKYPVMYAYHFPQGVCTEGNGTIIPVIPPPGPSGALFAAIIVPAVIVAILIFLIGLLLLCMHKRKRLSGKLLLEDEKPIFSKNRKPIYLEGEMELEELDEKPKRPVMLFDDGNPVYDPPAERPTAATSRPAPPPYQMPYDGGFGGVFDQMEDSLIPPPDYQDGSLTFRQPPPYRLPPPYIERPSSTDV